MHYIFNQKLIRTKRDELGLSQSDLAKKLGISRVMVSKYETGEIEPPISKLLSIVEQLQAKPEDFFQQNISAVYKYNGDFILDLVKEPKGYGSHTATIVELLKLNIDTVKNPFCIKPVVFNYFHKNQRFPEGFFKELEYVYNKVTAGGLFANIRTPDIITEKQVSIPFNVGNRTFINNYQDFKQTIMQRYQMISDNVKDSKAEGAKVSFLLQSTYDSHECGIIQTDDGYGNILIEAAWGQSTNIFSRDDIDPDMYLVSKKDMKIKSKKVGNKEYELSFNKVGIVKVKINDKRKNQQVFTDAEIMKYAKNAVRIEKAYGPKEIECAITTEKNPIIVETRNMLVVRKEKTADNITILYPGEVSGDVSYAESLYDLPLDCKDKIIATSNVDINFITLLVYKYKPRAVICLQGNVTSHASTILRESRTVSYIIPECKLENHEKITLHKDGSYAKN